MDGRQTGSNPFHRSSGPLAAILPLFPRHIQFPIPVGLNLLLMPAEPVLQRDVSRWRCSDGWCNGLRQETLCTHFYSERKIKAAKGRSSSRRPSRGSKLHGSWSLKSTGVGSMGGGIVALAVSNCVIFAASWRFQGANPGH